MKKRIAFCYHRGSSCTLEWYYNLTTYTFGVYGNRLTKTIWGIKAVDLL